MKNLVFIFLLIVFCLSPFLSGNSYCQDLVNSRKSSYFTYIYKISDSEAGEIYKNNTWEVKESIFHTLIDSFPTDLEYEKILPAGHYLKTYSEKNRQKISIASVNSIEAFIINNNTDLIIQLYDRRGNLINDAEVMVRSKRLRFDPNRNAYVDKKSNQKGLLKVTQNGFTSYYRLNRIKNNPVIKRASNKVLYQTPVKYAWIPINFVVRLPIDGVRSIKNGWAGGTIYSTKNFFIRSYHKVACLFDDYHCDHYSNYKYYHKYKGYMVFNKPKYLPEDNVKFKAFITDKNGRGVTNPAKVVLSGNGKNINLTVLNPYRKGGFEFEFILHDSLNLQLDRIYTVYLEDANGETYLNGSFKYEDYELSKTKLQLIPQKTTHFQGDSIKIFVKGTDENGLNILDGRLEIGVYSGEVADFFTNRSFVPDTLFFEKKSLNPTGETEIVIKDSGFPKVNFEYNVSVKLLTSDNESISEDTQITYYFDSDEFIAEMEADSIFISYQKNGEKVNKNAKIFGRDNFGNQTEVYSGPIPAKVELNPYFSSYNIVSDTISQLIEINTYQSLIQCFSQRTSDSLMVVIDNPRKIPFNYFIYQKNSEKYSGYVDALKLNKKSNSKQNYHVTITYLWAGKIQSENYGIPLMDSKLNIAVNQPKLIYPGQKTNIEVTVTDFENNPVEGVDLTAYGLTKKFNYDSPRLLYLGKVRKGKSLINTFNFTDDESFKHTERQLDYNSWKVLAGLDSIEYYKFLYPGESIYRHESDPEEKISQFSPFVVSNGTVQPADIVYVDKIPVYFSWNTFSQPYSFAIDSGYHEVKLRTNTREITIDSLFIQKDKKLTLSIDPSIPNKYIKVETVTADLSQSERNFLYNFIFPYKNNFKSRISYLEKGDNVHLLGNLIERGGEFNFAGPVSGDNKFVVHESFSTEFLHEPFMTYEFAPNLLKMRSISWDKYPKTISSKIFYDDFLSSQVISKSTISNIWGTYLEANRKAKVRYANPKTTSKGFGKLKLEITSWNNLPFEHPLNLLVLKFDDHEFIRVYPGNTQFVHNLAEGDYKLVLFYTGSRYQIADSIQVKKDGLNYLNFVQPEVFEKDTFSLQVSELIEKTIFYDPPNMEEEERELRNIYGSYQNQFEYSGPGNLIRGQVFDEMGDLLPGVSVSVAGTLYGTTTDINGQFSLIVPFSKKRLVFSFIGFSSEEKTISNPQFIEVTMKPSVLALQEVVVVGFGGQEKVQLSSSVSTVMTESFSMDDFAEFEDVGALQGVVAGVLISSSGSVGSTEVSIRGQSTVKFDQSPLYIINGHVFNGDIAELDPELIQKIEILKDEASLKAYGTRGKNGVILIQTKTGTFLNMESKGADFDNGFFEVGSQANSIRNNFSDAAFWHPKLVTDKSGKASFEVTFPDDVTSWETFYLAMNEKKQSGQSKGQIKSYKPLMAQVNLPRFLVASDTVIGIGKVLNYLQDSVELTTNFEINGNTQFERKQYVVHSQIDSLKISSTDSISVKYSMKREDGYFDGEIRQIPVFPKGLEETKGYFYSLDTDTTVNLISDPTLGKVTLYARADFLDMLEDEIYHVKKYKYLCNEQIASKLKMLLALKRISTFNGEQFEFKKETEKLIGLLGDNENSSGLWGWWPDSQKSLWISLHVLEALVSAQLEGFQPKINIHTIVEKLIWELESSRDFYDKVRMLKILKLLNSKISFTSYIAQIEKTAPKNLSSYLEILELKSLNQEQVGLKDLLRYQKSSLFGNLYFADDSSISNIYINDIQNTLKAYKIIRRDSTADKSTLLRIRNYLLENRKSGFWRNTYESAQIIETILPDILDGNKQAEKTVLSISGDINRTFQEFPFEIEFEPDQSLQIAKSGSAPVYLTTYQRYWNQNPESKQNDFSITTKFSNDSLSYLKAGKETILIAEVEVKKDSEFVMINIPIPAGCSYGEKRMSLRIETHREYFKNETAIFCETLPKGKYTFEIELQPRYSGSYTLNPAKVELMYFPVFNANNELKKISIQ